MSAERWLAVTAICCLLVSLLLPAIQGSGFPTLSGFDVLRQGAGGWRAGVIAWYANPILVVALIATLLAHFKTGLVAALFGTLLALSSFVAGTIAETTGRSVPAFSYALGFYIWLLAFVIATVAALFGIYKESRSPEPG